MICAQIVYIQIIFLYKHSETGVLRRTDLFQSIFDDQTVFILQLHDIPHGRNGRKLQKLHPLMLRNSKILIDHVYKLPCYDRTANFMVRIRLPVLLRINHCICRRQNLSISIYRYFMMIGHHNRHAKLLCDADLL